MTDAATYERDLTPKELEQRTARRDQLDDQRDDLIASVAERRKEIRALNASKKRLELELLDVRREIRSGKVIESKQLAFPIVEVTDNADPFEKAFPQALTAERLHRDLSLVLQGVLVPSIATIEEWHPGIFLGIAHWARVELAYMNRNGMTTPLELPPRGRMPDKLAEARELLGRRPAKKKRGERAPQSPTVGELAEAEAAAWAPTAGKKRPARKTKVRTGKRGARA